jgi:hypothetical protein
MSANLAKEMEEHYTTFIVLFAAVYTGSDWTEKILLMSR